MGWDKEGLYIQSQYGSTVTDKHYFTLTPAEDMNKNTNSEDS